MAMEAYARRGDLVTLCFQKLSCLNEENERFFVDLEKLRQLIDDHVTREEEIDRLKEQNRKLQDAMGEVQLSLLQEREQVMRLTTENTRFRFKELEDKRKMEALVAKVGGSGNELIRHVYDSKSRMVVFQPSASGNCKKSTTSLSSQSAGGAVLWNDGERDDGEQVRLLQQELEQQAKLHRETVSAMDADRKLLIMERDAERMRDADDIRRISQRLRDLETLFQEVMKDKLMRCKNFSGEIGKILKQQVKKGPSLDAPGPSRQLDIDEKEALEKRIKDLQRELADKQRESDHYRAQAMAADMLAHECRDQIDEIKRQHDDKMEKCRDRIELLKKQYDRLDSRRRLEALGFRSEIRIVQDQLKRSEQLMLRVVSNEPGVRRRGSSTPPSSSRRSRSAASVQSSKSLKGDLKKVKSSIAKLEKFLGDLE